MRTTPLAATLLLVPLLGVGIGLGLATGARREPPSAAPTAPPTGLPTLETLLGKDAAWTSPLLDGAAWRPGRDEWAEWRGKGKERALWLVDAVSGTERALVRVADVEEPQKGAAGPRPIGRGSVPQATWTPDGSALLVRVGGDFHRVNASDGAHARLAPTPTEISDVRISPDGARIAYAREFEVRVAPLAAKAPEDGGERRLTENGSDDRRNAGLDWVYPEELDAGTGLWWSPEGERLAHLALDETGVPRHEIVDAAAVRTKGDRQPYPNAGDPIPTPSVHVVSLAGGPPVRLDAGGPDTYVPWAAWWPDGDTIGVATLDRAQTSFAVRLCDARTGALRATILDEHDERWVDVPPPPRFLKKSPAFLWRTRASGWWRLVRVGLDDGSRTALTPDGVEAGSVLAVDEDADVVFYEGTDTEGLRRQVLRAPLRGGGAPTLVTDAGRSHAASFSTTGRYFLDTESTASIPPRVVLRRADGTQVRVLADAATSALAALHLPVPTFLRVPVGDDELPAMRIVPVASAEDRPLPTIVHVYGGPGANHVRDAWLGGSGLLHRWLAARGYAVVWIDGRIRGGHGKAAEARAHRRLGALETEDVAAAATWLTRQPWVEKGRVGLWGWSYGGYLTALALAKTDAFAAGVAVAPVTDWTLYDAVYTERYMDLPSENPDGYAAGSVVEALAHLRAPLLVCHGLCDDNVHVQNTLRLQEHGLGVRAPLDVALYPSRGHGIQGPDALLDLFGRLVRHFDAHLRDAPRRP